MISFRQWICAGVVWVLFPVLCVAEEEIKGVDMELVSSVEKVGAGSAFTVGLKIHHHEGFHTYWKNPGTVGYPTQISWVLPEGFVAGEVRWPVPEMSAMAGHPVFGYERDVMLLVEITSPAELPEGKLEFHADVAWMACADECRPGRERFSLSLKSGEKTVADAAVSELFKEAEQSVPKKLEGWTAVLESGVDEGKIVFRMTAPEGLPDPGTLRVFSNDGQISLSPMVTKVEGGGYRVEVERAEYSPEGVASLPFVLVGEKVLGKEGETFGTLEPRYPVGD